MVSIPEEELERLKEKNRQQARQLTQMQACLGQKNLELDALHFVWCDGGCSGGVHRFLPDVVLTEEMLVRAERSVLRLRKWYNTAKRHAGEPAMSKWQEERAKLLTKKIGLAED